MKRDILVVEDSATQAEALASLLRSRGYIATVARSGEAALEQLDSGDFAAVVSDIVMPGISGYELCRRIKADGRTCAIPVLLVTTLGDPMDIVRGLEAGADNYITKPYDPDQLLARVGRVIDNARLRPQGRTSMGVNIEFLGSSFTITSDREQILDLLLSSVEDILRTNQELEARQDELTEAHEQLEAYARVKAHEAQVSTERYSALMRNASDAIFLLDPTGRILEANVRAADLLGRPTQELLWRTLVTYMPAADAVAFDEWLGELHSGAALPPSDRLLMRADGSARTVELSGSVTHVDDESLLLAIARDVTAQRENTARLRRSEERLRESETLFRTLVNAAPVGIIELDVDALIRIWNPEAERIFGWSADEVSGSPFPFMNEMEQQQLRDVWARIAAGEEYVTIEGNATRRDGTAADLHIATAPMRDDAEITGIIFIVSDVTERKRAEVALRQSEEHLRQAQRMDSIGRLTGGIAHDFNNMLTAIKGSTELLLMDLTGDDAMRTELEEIDRAANRAALLTRQLLAFSRHQVLQPRIVDINEVVRNVEGMLRRLISEEVELEARLKSDVGLIVADPNQLEQVIMNLVVNARDAMPTGGRITIESDSVAAPPQGQPALEPRTHVVLRVCDNGSGMPASVRDRIFEPFFTTKEVGKGTGLGLSTVYGIVAQTGGHIEVDSEPGRGTVFTIFLPVADEETAPLAIPPAPAPTTQTRSLEGTETVLLVEDEESVRRLAARILRRHGYSVIEAAGPHEALATLENGINPELLITDLVMGGMNGRELAQEIRRHLPGIRVLLMSGYSAEDVGSGLLRTTDFTLLEKPFTPAAFAQTIRAVLDQ